MYILIICLIWWKIYGTDIAVFFIDFPKQQKYTKHDKMDFLTRYLRL